MLAVWDRLANLSVWLQTDDRGNMVYVLLALALLAELSIRVARRFVADRRAKIAAAHDHLRLSSRMRRARSA